MRTTSADDQWALVRARERLSPRTIARFRKGLPVRMNSLARIARAVEALGLQHLLREQGSENADG